MSAEHEQTFNEEEVILDDEPPALDQWRNDSDSPLGGAHQTAVLRYPDWFADNSTPERVEGATDEQVAYMLRFLRTDLHVLAVLASAHLGIGTSSELNAFFRKMDLEGEASYLQGTLSDVQTEITDCVYGGFSRKASTIDHSLSYDPAFPSLVANAGHLYNFSKKTGKPLSAFVGLGATGNHLTNPHIFANQDIRFTLDRMRMIRALGELWKEQKYDPRFSTTQKALADEVGASAPSIGRHLMRLANDRLLTYSTKNPRGEERQTYRLSPNFRLRQRHTQEHVSLADYLREYAVLVGNRLSPEGACEYIAMNHPHLVPETEEGEWRERIREEIYDLASPNNILVLETPFKFGVSSWVAFDPTTGYEWLVDYLKVLDDIQEDSQESERKGMILGQEISVDKEGLTRIFRKLDRIYQHPARVSQNGVVFKSKK